MKKLNSKGFTLIELLAVIVILAILVAVSVPAVTKYLATARKGTFADNAQTAISAVRNDVISKFETSGNTSYDLAAINALLEKKLNKSPYGKAYETDSYVSVTANADGSYSYSICIHDAGGNGIVLTPETEVNETAVTTGVSSCTVTTP